MKNTKKTLQGYPQSLSIIALFTLFCFIPFLGMADTVGTEEKIVEERGTHASLDVQFKNSYITPRGLLVIEKPLVVQVTANLSFDVYKSNCSLINEISLFIGTWNNMWSRQDSPFEGAWNEMDWWIGANFTIAKNWKFSAAYIQFLSPPQNFVPANNLDFVLTYDDSGWKLPVTFNPYLRLWYTVTGGSVVITGKEKYTYYFEFGVTPTVDFTKNCILPITLKFPTYIQVGPSSFWNGGLLALKDENSRFGVVSTGVVGIIPLKFMPARLGKWYVDAGAQYYYLINRNLLHAQQFTTVQAFSLKDAHRNLVSVYAGLGVEF